MGAVASGYIRFGFSLSGGVSGYAFQVSGVVTAPTAGTVYTNNGQSFTVIDSVLVSGSGTLYTTGTGAPTASGTLSSAGTPTSISYSSVSQFVDLSYLAIRGLDDPDDVEFTPNIKNDYVDFSSDTQFKGVRRLITIDLDVVVNRTDRIALLYWAMCNTRTIDYNTGTYSEAALRVDPQDVKGFFKSTWGNGFVGARYYTFALQESLVGGGSPVRTAWPV